MSHGVSVLTDIVNCSSEIVNCPSTERAVLVHYHSDDASYGLPGEKRHALSDTPDSARCFRLVTRCHDVIDLGQAQRCERSAAGAPLGVPLLQGAGRARVSIGAGLPDGLHRLRPPAYTTRGAPRSSPPVLNSNRRKSSRRFECRYDMCCTRVCCSSLFVFARTTVVVCPQAV